MIIYRDMETNILTQDFNESRACIKTDISGRIIYTTQVKGKIGGICPFGFKDFYRAILNMLGHNGWDNLVYYREPLYFPAMAETRWWAKRDSDSSGGVGVDVFSLDRVAIKEEDLPDEIGEHAKNDWKANGGKIRLKLRFWHLWDSALWGKPMIQVGTFGDGRPEMMPEVKTGDLIGWCDNTGLSTGDHSHNGEKFTAKNSMTLDSNNGYFGAVNLSNLFRNEFILDVLGKKQQLSASQRISRLILNVRERKTRLRLKNLSSFLFASGE